MRMVTAKRKILTTLILRWERQIRRRKWESHPQANHSYLHSTPGT
jgi:hypothetical protein